MGSAKRKSTKKRCSRASEALSKSNKKTASPAPTEAPILESQLALPATFHKFNLLPTELRDQIWKLSLPGPRIVHLELTPFRLPTAAPPPPTNEEINFYMNTFSLSSHQSGLNQIMFYNKSVEKWACKARASQPAPALLVVYVCDGGQKASVWLSYELDTVYLSAGVLSTLSSHEYLGSGDTGIGVDLGKVEKVLLDNSRLVSLHAIALNRDCDWVCGIIGWFGNLKQVTFVPEDKSGVPSNGELAIADLVLFDRHMKFYEAGFNAQKDWQQADRFARKVAWENMRQELAVRTIAQWRFFEDYRALIINGLQPVSWKMPELDRKTITTKTRKAAYDTAFAKYMKDRDNYKESLIAQINISIPGDISRWSGWFPFVATHAKTVKDVVEELREDKNLPQETEIRFYLLFASQMLEEVAPEVRILDRSIIKKSNRFVIKYEVP